MRLNIVARHARVIRKAWLVTVKKMAAFRVCNGLFGIVIVFTLSTSQAAGLVGARSKFHQYSCRDSSEFDRVIVVLESQSGETQTVTFVGSEKILLIEARELYGILDWQHTKAIHLRSSDNSDETLLSIKYVNREGNIKIFEGGYVSADCLSNILNRFETRIKFIRS